MSIGGYLAATVLIVLGIAIGFIVLTVFSRRRAAAETLAPDGAT